MMNNTSLVYTAMVYAISRCKIISIIKNLVCSSCQGELRRKPVRGVAFRLRSMTSETFQVFLVLSLIISLCFSASDKFQYIPLKKSKHYPITLTEDKTNPPLTEIFVDLPEQNELRQLGSHADVYLDHPHPAEYRGNTLYLLKKRETFNGVLTELWQYRGEKSKMIYAAYNYLTFRVSPDDKYIAIFADEKLMLLSTSGEKKRTLNWKDFYPKTASARAVYNLQPANWSNTEFWFVLKNSQNRVERVFFMSAQNWKYMSYDDLPLKPIEYVISPQGIAAYSNFGLTKQKPFSLYTYNLKTKRAELIATSNYGFEPAWRGDKLDFNSPANGKTRVTKFE